MGRSPFLFIFVFVFLVGCAPSVAKLKEKNLSLLRGYNNPCEGKILFSEDDGTSTSQLTVKAGPQLFTINHQSELIPQVGGVVDNYFCSENTIQQVSFIAEPGKVYRFYADRIEPKQYRITAYEYLDPRFPEAKSIETKSIQHKFSVKCGFKSSLLDCRIK